MTARDGSRRPLLPAALVSALLVPALAACGASSVTATRLDRDVATTVGNLYAEQQRRLGVDDPLVLGPEWVASRASCLRAGSDTPTRGAGTDWVCAVRWNGTDGAERTATFDVEVTAAGCFAAQGQPPEVGPATLRPHGGGAAVINPLYQLDGCLTGP